MGFANHYAPPEPAQLGWDGISGWDAAAEAPSRLRADDASLVRSRKVPPAMGWRHAVWVGSAHAVNLGAGAYEQALLDDQALIASNIPGNYQIAFVSVRGGVGKTATTAGVGTAFAKYRTDQVIAIDANPTYGKLARRVDPRVTASIVEFTNDHKITGYPMARQHTGKNAQGLEVLASNQNVANHFQLTSGVFGAALSRTRRFYQLALVDCGPEIEHDVMGAVIGAADALVIVGTMNYDGAEAAETTMNWLAARNKHDLLRRSVLVLNDIYDNAAKPFVEKVHETLGKRVGSVATIPWDEHVRDAAVLDWEALRTPTERAYISVAATLAKGFPTAGTVQTKGGGPSGTVRR
jgi:MinD-like ATPase involved in chromosome partitioning or flagellar assembly